MSFQEYYNIHNIDEESITVDYSKNITGEEPEIYQNIDINVYKSVVEKENIEKEISIDVDKCQRFYDELLEYRKSKTKHGNSYYVLQEETIYKIYKNMPLTLEELIIIEGIGEIKLEQYGEDLISIINKYLDLKSIDRPEISRIKDDREFIGTKWTVEEEKQLLEEFADGMKISEIAKLHSRTPGGIRSRLKKLGAIE